MKLHYLDKEDFIAFQNSNVHQSLVHIHLQNHRLTKQKTKSQLQHVLMNNDLHAQLDSSGCKSIVARVANDSLLIFK